MFVSVNSFLNVSILYELGKNPLKVYIDPLSENDASISQMTGNANINAIASNAKYVKSIRKTF